MPRRGLGPRTAWGRQFSYLSIGTEDSAASAVRDPFPQSVGGGSSAAAFADLTGKSRMNRDDVDAGGAIGYG